MRCAIVCASIGASSSSAKSGSCGRGSASARRRHEAVPRSHAIASRSSIGPLRRSPPTAHETSSASSLLPMPWPARVSSAHACGWCQCTQPPPISISSPPQSRYQVRPPSRSRASISVQSSPAIVSSRAAATPAKPPPITIASSTRGVYRS